MGTFSGPRSLTPIIAAVDVLTGSIGAIGSMNSE
jgi:hypothetical protein